MDGISRNPSPGMEPAIRTTMERPRGTAAVGARHWLWAPGLGKTVTLLLLVGERLPGVLRLLGPLPA